MACVTQTVAGMTVTAHVGDCKLRLAFDFDSDARTKDLAGFKIQCKPGDKPDYYLVEQPAV